MTETEKKFSDYLETVGFNYSVEYKGEQTRDNWKCDAWVFTIKGQGFGFDYYTGLGNRKANKPSKPQIAGLLYSIIMDGIACDMTFEDWCGDLGYDTDSRKALETYLLCQSNSAKYKKIFKPEQRAIIEEILQDY